MEFRINPKHLHDALAHTVADKKSILNIYGHVLIAAKGEAVTLTTCDGARELEVKIPAAVKKAGSATADVQRLKSSLIGLEGEITVTSTGKISHVKQGARHFKYPSENVVSFPTGPEIDQVDSLDIDLVELADAISCVAYAVDTHDIRRYLNGVALHDDWVIGASGNRMAAVPLDGVQDCIIPKDSIPNLVEVLRHEGAKLYMGRAIEACSPTRRFRTALIDAKTPDYGRLLRMQDDAPSVAASVTDIKAGLSRAVPFAESFGDKTTKFRRICISREGDSGMITAGDDEAIEPFDAEFKGEWKPIYLDPGFFSDAINACGGDFEWFSTSPDAQQFFIPKGSDSMHIVMPQKA